MQERAQQLVSSGNDPRHERKNWVGQMGLLEISADCWDSHTFTQLGDKTAQTTDMTGSDQLPPLASATSSKLADQVACWELDSPGCESHLHALRSGSLIFRERAPCHGFKTSQEPGAVVCRSSSASNTQECVREGRQEPSCVSFKW